MHTVGRTLASRSPLAVFLAAVLMVGTIGWLDYRTGIYLSFALFYLAPIGLCTRYAGRAWGLGVAAICASVGLIGDLSSLGTYGVLPIWNAVTRLGVFVVVVVVLARLREAHEAERLLARTDPLTGAANFRWFEEEAQREMYSSRRYGGPLSLAYLDLDDFKRVNDEHGHAAGDAVLRCVADTLRFHLRPTDLVARVGGDEFVVLLPHTDRDGAERALARVAEDLGHRSDAAPILFSLGVIQLDQAVGSIDDLLGKADERMYEVKRARREMQAAPAPGSGPGATELV
jgi:diguanylate cyclase (GGDEF)-like protein